MKIESHDWTVKELFNQGYFVIPRFQRPYSWDRENIEEFWSDTISEETGQYFIGSMVVFRQEQDSLGVVDGQQRLTTIVTTLCALRNALNAEGHPELAQGIHNLIEKKDINNRDRYILSSETSYPYFQKKILGKNPPDEDSAAKDEELKLEFAFEFISEQITDAVESVRADSTIKNDDKPAKIGERLAKIRDRILELKLIYVKVDDVDDAYTIFETLNTRGKDLTTVDLVKNHFTRLIKQENVDVDLARDLWNKVLEIIQGSEAGLDADTFLLHYWLSRHDYTNQQRLFKKFRKEVKRANAEATLIPSSTIETA